MKGWRSLRESLNTDRLSGNRPRVRDQRALQNHSIASPGSCFHGGSGGRRGLGAGRGVVVVVLC